MQEGGALVGGGRGVGGGRLGAVHAVRAGESACTSRGSSQTRPTS